MNRLPFPASIGGPSRLAILLLGVTATGCGSSSGGVAATHASCPAVAVTVSSADPSACEISTTCDDKRLYELSCKENWGAQPKGVYDRYLACTCSRERAVLGETALLGSNCSTVGGAGVETLQAAFQACNAELSIAK